MKSLMRLNHITIGFTLAQHLLVWIAVCLLLLFQTGCHTVDDCSPGDEIGTLAHQHAVSVVQSLQLIAGRSNEGQPIDCFVLGDLSTSDTRILLIASIHGSEPAGTPLLEKLIEQLKCGSVAIPPTTAILIMPNVNPDGVLHGIRRNMRGVDLNRNFPTTNWTAYKNHGDTPASEPETIAIMRVIEDFQPSLIISIHQPIACIDYDGPASKSREIAILMSDACDMKYRLPVKQLGARAGSLGSWAGIGLGIPTITLELPEGVEKLSDNILWTRYGAMLRVAVEFEYSQ